VRSEAVCHMTTPEPTSQLRDEVRSHRARGNIETHLNRKVKSKTIGHVTVCGYTPCNSYIGEKEIKSPLHLQLILHFTLSLSSSVLTMCWESLPGN
jgi:hypothetical protein